MTYDVPVQMTVSEGFGPIPAPASQIMVVTYEATEPVGESGLIYKCVFDKTSQEVIDAIQNGVTVLIKDKSNTRIAIAKYQGSYVLARFSYVQKISPPAYLANYLIARDVVLDYNPTYPDRNTGSYDDTMFPLTQNIIIATATQQTIGGADFLVLDKTFLEIRNSPFCVIKYSAGEWGTGYGVTASWYVYDVQETPMLIRASTWSGNSPELITFEALSDSDYPKMSV